MTTQLPEDESKFSPQAVQCLKAMGDWTFANALKTVPWGGRPHVLGRRYIMQKYLNNEDILQAYWVHEQQKRIDPQWQRKEPGLSHLSALMRERSGNRWQEEQAEYQKTTPSLMDYMEDEWGEATRQALAHHRRDDAVRRRAAFQVVSTTHCVVSVHREVWNAAPQGSKHPEQATPVVDQQSVNLADLPELAGRFDISTLGSTDVATSNAYVWFTSEFQPGDLREGEVRQRFALHIHSVNGREPGEDDYRTIMNRLGIAAPGTEQQIEAEFPS